MKTTYRPERGRRFAINTAPVTAPSAPRQSPAERQPVPFVRMLLRSGLV